MNKLQYKVTRFLCNTDNMNSKYCIIIFAWIVNVYTTDQFSIFRIAPEHSILKETTYTPPQVSWNVHEVPRSKQSAME